MLKTQFPGVKHLSRKIFRVLRAVYFITENRMTEMMKVHTDLMRPPAVQFAFDQADLIRRAHDPIFRLRCATAPGRDRHSLPMDRMTSDFLLNRSRALAQLSRHDSQIDLLDGTRCKLRR